MKFHKLVFAFIIVALAGCVEMTPEERVAYRERVAEQQSVERAARREFCKTSNTCTGTARAVREMCRQRVESRMNVERTDVYGRVQKRTLNNFLGGVYIDSRSSTYGNNGYFIFIADTFDEKYDANGIMFDREVTTWNVECITRGDTPNVLNVEYSIR
jgi:hypothetical protein